MIIEDGTETHQNSGKPSITTTAAIRLLLDKCANVNAGSVIGNLAVGTIILIISKVVASIFASPIAGDAASLLLGPVATELKTEAQENAPDSAYFSYNYSKYKYPDSPLTDSYFRYFGLYYPKKDLVGSPATSSIYEHCVNSYI